MTQTQGGPIPPPALDPLSAEEAGQYRDELVHVVRQSVPAADDPIVRTPHFCLGRGTGRRLELSHSLRPDQLDNDIAGLIVDELFTPGWLSGNDIFERVFTGVIRSTVHDPLLAWTTFYGNTLRRIRQAWAGGEPAGDHALIDGIAPVYARALELVRPGRVLDIASCFGFFALLLAERPRNSVLASDIVPGSMRLLELVSGTLRLPLETLVCDAATVPLPDDYADTVTVLHLLEHLEPEEGDQVVAEAVRLAAHRVVIAVPFEDEPAAVYGHVRRFDPVVLADLGASTGKPFTVEESHGGWLIVQTG